MLWHSLPNAGFTAAGVRPWLPLADNSKIVNVESQLKDKRSFLNFFRALMDYRKSSPALKVGSSRSLDLKSKEARKHCFVYERKAETEHLLVGLNFSGQEQKVSLLLTGTGKILISTSMDRTGELNLSDFTLEPNEGSLIFLQETP